MPAEARNFWDEDPNEPVCGVDVDHDLRLIDERDGVEMWKCDRCEAEITTEDEA